MNTSKETLYNSIVQAEEISKWWAPHQSTESDAGTILSHDPGPEHGIVKLMVVDATPYTRIEWQCISADHPPHSPASAWPGTHILWAISEEKNRPSISGFGTDSDQMTVLNFEHSGWDESSEYFAFCNFAWGCVLQKLKEYCESSN